MKRVSYVDLLDSLRAREPATEDALTERVAVARRRDAVKRVELRMTPEQRAFLRGAAKRARGPSVDESAIVAVAVSIVEALDVPWETIASRDELADAVRRRLRAR
jgi:hypothetical protein